MPARSLKSALQDFSKAIAMGSSCALSYNARGMLYQVQDVLLFWVAFVDASYPTVQRAVNAEALTSEQALGPRYSWPSFCHTFCYSALHERTYILGLSCNVFHLLPQNAGEHLKALEDFDNAVSLAPQSAFHFK